MGKAVSPPTRRAVALAVIENPFAGKFQDDLAELMAIGEELGEPAHRANAWRRSASRAAEAESFGKAAIVGEKGELEHAAAILHPKMGTPVRKVLSKGAGADPVGQEDGRTRHADRRAARPQGCGLSCARISMRSRCRVPRRAARQRDRGGDRGDRFRAGRLPRIGGLQKHEIKGEDGLR